MFFYWGVFQKIIIILFHRSKIPGDFFIFNILSSALSKKMRMDKSYFESCQAYFI